MTNFSHACESSKKSDNFINSIKYHATEYDKILDLQSLIRSGKKTESDLSNVEIIKLKSLYRKQIEEKNKNILKIKDSILALKTEK